MLLTTVVVEFLTLSIILLYGKKIFFDKLFYILNKYFNLILLFYIPVLTGATKTNGFECDQQKMDETTRWLFFFGDSKHNIPETEAERSQFCS